MSIPGPVEGSSDVRESPELLPARMLNEFVYCPRLFHLEWVQKEWADSADTEAGRRDHRVVDDERGKLPSPEEWSGQKIRATGVTLEAPGEGLVACIDLLEGEDGGTVVPVDTKHGRMPQEGGMWEADRVQLGAQALILRENGYRCEEIAVWYAGSRRRVRLPVDTELEGFVRESLRKARETASSDVPPPPLVDSPKCPRCSLVGICLPDEQNALAGLLDQGTEVRPMVALRDDARPVYVQEAGARVGKVDEELEIRPRDGDAQRVRLLDVSQLSLLGAVQVTAQATAALLGRGIPICHFSHGGWFHGVTHAIGNRNAALRLHQYAACVDPARSLEIARGLVARKIRNARTMLRRNGKVVPRLVLEDLARAAEQATQAADMEGLLGIEGWAARTYFQSFACMLRPPGAIPEFSFENRNRRPPKDPVNALLSLAYSILAKDWLVTLFAVGLDPFLGFYHRPRFGRASLALDLMEEFRPLVAESVVLQLINNGEVRPSDFIARGAGVALTDGGRRSFFLAYERRMTQEVRHPIFGYQVSYRRLLEIQARLLGRHLTGELPEYTGFQTR